MNQLPEEPNAELPSVKSAPLTMIERISCLGDVCVCVCDGCSMLLVLFDCPVGPSLVTSSQPSFMYPQIALPSLGPHPGAREPVSTHPSLVSMLRGRGLKVTLFQSTSFVSKTFLTIDFPLDSKFHSFCLSSLLDFN